MAFSDEGGIHTATRNSDGWFVRQIIAAGSRPLGQLVSFAIDDDGTYHLEYFEVTNTSPLDGVVYYATTAG